MSPVFGYYRDVKSEDDYQRYLERIHTPYYVVQDEAGEHLVKQFAMQLNTKYLIPQILITESNQDDWNVDENGVGGVPFCQEKWLTRLLRVESSQMAYTKNVRLQE